MKQEFFLKGHIFMAMYISFLAIQSVDTKRFFTQIFFIKTEKGNSYLNI